MANCIHEGKNKRQWQQELDEAYEFINDLAETQKKLHAVDLSSFEDTPEGKKDKDQHLQDVFQLGHELMVTQKLIETIEGHINRLNIRNRKVDKNRKKAKAARKSRKRNR